MRIETTCRMPRDELLGLLNTMTPLEQQRITTEMAAVAEPAELVVRFKRARTLTNARLVVIGASFIVSFGFGMVLAML